MRENLIKSLKPGTVVEVFPTIAGLSPEHLKRMTIVLEVEEKGFGWRYQEYKDGKGAQIKILIPTPKEIS